MDVNSIKAATESAASVDEIETILKTAFDNNISGSHDLFGNAYHQALLGMLV